MDENSLQHYGVLGMKWGVIRNRRKLEKAAKRVDKLKAKKKELDRLTRSKNKLNKMLEEEQTLKSKLKKGKPGGKPDADIDNDAKGTDAKSKKHVKTMTDDELRTRINRLNMEKQYKDLTRGDGVEKTSKGKEVVREILIDSSKNVGKQFVTYAIGTGVNKMFASKFGESQIVNPKKGQKDK